MKKKWKVIMSVFTIALATALIGGATMAWFTDDTTLASAEFTAGTVTIDAEGPNVVAMEDRFIDNVNPGDCATVCWDIVNTGTKSTELRVKLSDLWTDDRLDTENVNYAPHPDTKWAMYEEEDEVWFYYTGGPVAGTYGDAEPTIAELCVVVAFDGESTGNEYQGKTYRIKGEAEAVQSTNGAPAAVWGEGFTLATDEDYNFDHLIDYFLNGAGKDMPCWTGKTEDEEPGTSDPVAEHKVTVIVRKGSCGQKRGTVTGAGNYAEGTEVVLIATPIKAGVHKSNFENWTINGEIVSAEEEYRYIMGNEDVKIVANFTHVLGHNSVEDDQEIE